MFDLKKEYTTAVRHHIKQAVTQYGSFHVVDNKPSSERKLSPVRIHDEKIVSLVDNRFFACADSKEARPGKIIDLDFYATHSNKFSADLLTDFSEMITL